MKRSCTLKSGMIGVAALLLFGAADTLDAAQHKTPQSTTENEFPFEAQGKVSKHGYDKCMSSINYDLRSDVKAPLLPKLYWLAAVAKSDKAALEQASKDGSLILVKGTMMTNVEGCTWISVSSVTPVKKSTQKKNMSKELIYSVDSVTITYIKKNPPEYRIDATGKTTTSGWSNPELSAVVYVQAPPDGIYDFDFVAEPPSGMAAQVLTPIKAQKVLGKMPKGFRGVRVSAKSNKKEALLGEIQKSK
jgi:hypothetical protein